MQLKLMLLKKKKKTNQSSKSYIIVIYIVRILITAVQPIYQNIMLHSVRVSRVINRSY